MGGPPATTGSSLVRVGCSGRIPFTFTTGRGLPSIRTIAQARTMWTNGVAAIEQNSDGALPNAGGAGLSPKRLGPRGGLPYYGEPWELI